MSSTVLLSYGESAALYEANIAHEPVRMVSLQGGVDAQNAGTGQPVNLFSAILSFGWWTQAERLVLGKSLLTGLSPELIGGIIAALETVAGRALADAEPGTALKHRPNAKRLGDWMLQAVREAGSDNVTTKELEYFIASGGCRAHALSKVLHQHYPGRYPTLIDFGAGIGLISYMLALDPSFGIERTILVELLTCYAETAGRLWHEGPVMHFQHSAAEKFVPAQPLDIAFYGQMIYRIPAPERQALFQRVWDSLRAGGLLIVNEHIGEKTARHYNPPVLRRDELVGLLLPLGRPSLYIGRDQGAIPHDPLLAPLTDYGSLTFLVVQKND